MVGVRVAGTLRGLGALVYVSVGLTQAAACQMPGEEQSAAPGRAQPLVDTSPTIDGFWLNNPGGPSGRSVSEGYELGIRFKTTFSGTGATIRGIRHYIPFFVRIASVTERTSGAHRAG
jgi:hypothetical protein